MEPTTAAPLTPDEALKVAIKLAVDAGDYERAGLLIDVAKRTRPATVTPLALAGVRAEPEAGDDPRT